MNTIIVEGGKDMGNRIYPIGIQNFEKIRKEGYVYVCLLYTSDAADE